MYIHYKTYTMQDYKYGRRLLVNTIGYIYKARQYTLHTHTKQ